MEPFNTQKRKISTFKEVENKDSVREERQQEQNDIELNNIQQDNVYQYQFKKLVNVSTEWVDLIQEEDFGSPQIERQYQTWTIEFDTFDIRLLPFISVDIIYKNSINEEPDMSFSTKNVYFEITDIEDEEFYKKLKIITNLRLNTESVLDPEIGRLTIVYQARAMVTFINPKEYI